MGEVANYYPVLNVIAVAIMTITLRNNLLLLFYRSDLHASQRARTLWTLGLSLPCFVAAFLDLDTTDIVEVTGGVLGVAILAITPALLAYFARKREE